MNASLLTEILNRVAARTIESLGLMFLVPEEEMPAGDLGPEISVRVAFSGPQTGFLLITAPERVAIELGANMLGLMRGADLPADKRGDALMELANVVCGNLLPEIAGKSPVFHVSAPEIIGDEVIGAAQEGRSTVTETRLFLDAGPIEIKLFVQQGQEAFCAP